MSLSINPTGISWNIGGVHNFVGHLSPGFLTHSLGVLNILSLLQFRSSYSAELCKCWNGFPVSMSYSSVSTPFVSFLAADVSEFGLRNMIRLKLSDTKLRLSLPIRHVKTYYSTPWKKPEVFWISDWWVPSINISKLSNPFYDRKNTRGLPIHGTKHCFLTTFIFCCTSIRAG